MVDRSVRLLGFVTVVGLVGCSDPAVRLRGPSGDIVTCRGGFSNALDQSDAMKQIACVEAFQRQGYRRLSE